MEAERCGRARGVGPKRRLIGTQRQACNSCVTPFLERTERLAVERTRRRGHRTDPAAMGDQHQRQSMADIPR